MGLPVISGCRSVDLRKVPIQPVAAYPLPASRLLGHPGLISGLQFPTRRGGETSFPTLALVGQGSWWAWSSSCCPKFRIQGGRGAPGTWSQSLHAAQPQGASRTLSSVGHTPQPTASQLCNRATLPGSPLS